MADVSGCLLPRPDIGDCSHEQVRPYDINWRWLCVNYGGSSFQWFVEDPLHVFGSVLSYLRSAIDMSDRPVSDLTPLTAAMLSLLV